MEHFMHLLASTSRGSPDRGPVRERAGRSGWNAAAGDGVGLAWSLGAAGLRGRRGRADGGAPGLGRLRWCQQCATLGGLGTGSAWGAPRAGDGAAGSWRCDQPLIGEWA